MSVPERDNTARVPVFNAVPPAVLILGSVIVSVYVLGALMPAVQDWSRLAGAVLIAGNDGRPPIQPLGSYAPYLLHVFVHFGFLHVAMNTAALVGFGTAVGRAFGTGTRGTVGFLIFFFACSLGGALLELVLHTGGATAMAGASTGVSGLLMAAGWVRGGYRGMLSLGLPWVGFNLLIGLTNIAIDIPIGWLAHIGGSLVGAVLFPVILPIFNERRT
jgi:membrane associated rhomboid family serine protease